MLLYAIAVAFVCGLLAAMIACKLLATKWSYVLAVALAAVLAVAANVGVLQAVATFFSDAPFNAAAGMKAAGNSFWLSLVLAIVSTRWLWSKRKV